MPPTSIPHAFCTQNTCHETENNKFGVIICYAVLQCHSKLNVELHSCGAAASNFHYQLMYLLFFLLIDYHSVYEMLQNWKKCPSQFPRAKGNIFK